MMLSVGRFFFDLQCLLQCLNRAAYHVVFYTSTPPTAKFQVMSDNLTMNIEANYKRVKQEILSLVDAEIERIKNNPNLAHLMQ
jgi:traG family protein